MQIKFAAQVQVRDGQKSTRGLINGFNDKPQWKLVTECAGLIFCSDDLTKDKVRLFRQRERETSCWSEGGEKISVILLG